MCDGAGDDAWTVHLVGTVFDAAPTHVRVGHFFWRRFRVRFPCGEGYGKVVPVGISFVTVRDRPDLVSQMWDLPTPWPTFMQQDVISDFTYDLMPVRYPEYQLLAVDGDQVRARVNAVPYAWSGVDEDLPENGWDFALGMAFRPEMPGAATAVCLIEARIHPEMAGAGLGSELLLAARENAAALGYRTCSRRFGQPANISSRTPRSRSMSGAPVLTAHRSTPGSAPTSDSAAGWPGSATRR